MASAGQLRKLRQDVNNLAKENKELAEDLDRRGFRLSCLHLLSTSLSLGSGAVQPIDKWAQGKIACRPVRGPLGEAAAGCGGSRNGP